MALSYHSVASAQGLMFSSDHKYPVEAFEKIYIDKNQLVSMPDGLYYFYEDGNSEKVGTVLHDGGGTYILKIEYQCPLCGRISLNKTPDDEYDCPLFMRKIHPKIWTK